MKYLLIVAFALNLVMAGSIAYMMAMIRSLQIILHLPLMAVLVPGNINMLFQIMVPIIMFDVLDSDYSADLVLNFDAEGQEENLKSSQQTVDLGYETHNSILNLGSVFVFALFWFLQVFFYLLLKLSGRAKRVTIRLHNYLFYGGIISLLLEAYLDFVLSGFLNLQSMLLTTFGEILANWVGYISVFVSCILMPGIFIYNLSLPLSAFSRPHFL